MKKSMQKGITLIELVVSVTLLAAIILTAVSLLDFGEKSFFVLSDNGEIQTEAHNTTMFITSQIHESLSMTNTGGQSSRLDMVNKDGENVSFVWDGAQILSFVNNNNGDIRIISKNASSVVFNGTKDGVEIYIKLVSGDQNYELKTSVFRRLS